MTVRLEISPRMRDILIEHLDNHKVQVLRCRKRQGVDAIDARSRSCAVKALLLRGWITPSGKRGTRSRYTVITVKGREILARMLAEYAEILIRAGYAVEELRQLALPIRASSAGVLASRPQAQTANAET